VRRFLTLISALTVAGAVLAGCGSSKSGAGSKVTFEITQSGTTLAVNGPSSIDGGVVAVTVKNSGQTPTDLELIRVTGNHSADELKAVLDAEGGPLPSWIVSGGGVGTVAPGQSETATQKYPAGTYFAASSPDTEEGAPDIKPVLKPVQVTGDKGGSLPDATATVRARDYTFNADGLKGGRITVEFGNDGKQLHHFIAAPLAAGKTADDVKKALQEENPTGPPPIDFEAAQGVAVLGPGQSLVTTLNFKSGNYVFMCFIQDRTGGPPHAIAHGMVKEITVV
jgi:hypothetical protein